MSALAREARVVAQAKVNLFLRVLAREASGYHQLETLFQRLDLGDDVVVRAGAAGRSLDCRGAECGPVERNVAWRAAVAFADAAGWPNGFAIEIDKRVPVGGGLGGGSADAGAVLRCLNRLAPAPLSPADLLAVAATIGADVPFLTAEHALALAWGRGERMMALPALPPRQVHLALFAEGVSTPAAFGALAERRERDPASRRVTPVVWRADRLASWDDVALVASNDFEGAVFETRPDVEEVRAAFAEICREVDGDAAAAAASLSGDRMPFSLMTGSGATVALFSPLAVTLVMQAAGSPQPGGVRAFDVVATQTATRVAAVEVVG